MIDLIYTEKKGAFYIFLSPELVFTLLEIYLKEIIQNAGNQHVSYSEKKIDFFFF